MKLNIEPIRNWFGFTRRERRSSFILLLIIFIILALRFSVPEKNIAVEDVTAGISIFEESSGLNTGEIQSSVQLFSFDPNTASYPTLIKLGLDSKEANTLIKYRTKGGKFRNPSDIRKVYGIDEAKAVKLIPFVEVAIDTPRKAKIVSYRQQRPTLDINSCDSASLVRLPGIGPVLSARIIKYRRLLGGFASVNQLTEVYGLSPETFDLIKGRVYADSLALLRVDINSAGYKEISRLPYFEKYEVTAILKYKELKGSILSITDLIDNKILTEEKAVKVQPYLKFE
ncbi:MAG: helix-hairpin-helix domain-containing protein [Bacteroidota bacterium]